MFAEKNEENFFIESIKAEHRVLEYGSGYSTIEIAKRCFQILSIEHQELWFNELVNKVPENVEIVLKKPNLPYKEGGHCGTYDEFRDYVEAPLNKGPFDIILIDGRARVACSSIAKDLSHSDTLVFIHDFHRPEYTEALNYLDLIEQVGTMAKFKIKQ